MHCTYGTTESRTTFGFTCEHGMLFKGRPGMYHLTEDRILVEVLDRETRQPVAFGEEGEVVITTLLVEASPVLRFALADRAVLLPPNHCDCGRPFAGLEVGSIRRYDDMVKIRGMNLWPSAADGVVFSYPIAEYQAAVWFSQEGREEVTLAVEFLTKVSVEKKAGIMSELSRLLKDGTGLRINLEEAPYPLP